MATEIWDVPIQITTDGGDHFRSVCDSRAALETLMTCWPEHRGKAFAKAKQACFRSIDGAVAAPAAAQAFKKAAEEAGILRK